MTSYLIDEIEASSTAGNQAVRRYLNKHGRTPAHVAAYQHGAGWRGGNEHTYPLTPKARKVVV